MSATIPADRRLSATASAPVRAIEPRLRPLDILVLSAWCGLAGGLLEVGARIVGKSLLLPNRLVPDEPALRLAGPAVESAALLRGGLGPGSGGEALAAVRPMVRASAHRLPGDPARAHRPEPADLSHGLGDPRAGERRCAWPRSWSDTRPGCAGGCF